MLYTPASSLCGNPVLIGLVCAYTHIPHQSILFFKLKRCSFWDFSCKSLPLYFTEKNHPPEQHVYLRSRSVLLQRDVAFLRSISFEFTDDFLGAGWLHPYWMVHTVVFKSQIIQHLVMLYFFGDLLTNHHFSLQHHFIIFISTHIMCKKSPCRQASRLDHVIFDWFTCKSLHYMGKIYSIDRVK